MCVEREMTHPMGLVRWVAESKTVHDTFMSGQCDVHFSQSFPGCRSRDNTEVGNQKDLIRRNMRTTLIPPNGGWRSAYDGKLSIPLPPFNPHDSNINQSPTQERHVRETVLQEIQSL
jgi:hypothetical protein